jgi:hypothetical protein
LLFTFNGSEDAALENLHYTIFQHKQPDIIRVRDFGPNFARELEEPRYWDSPDAINLLDLQPKDGKYNADGLRQFLQKYSPEWLLDTAGRDERKLEKERKTLKISRKFSSIFVLSHLHGC